MPGQWVGVGWHGGHCGRCEPCRRSDFILCRSARVPGISYDGGYVEYMVAPVEALARIPGALSNVEAATLLCAGITTFNALRNSGARPGDVVAVLGVGGLGHLGVQFAAKQDGFRDGGDRQGERKRGVCKEMGCPPLHRQQRTECGRSAHRARRCKGHSSIATNSKAMSATIGGLAIGGKLIIVGIAEEPVEVPITLNRVLHSSCGRLPRFCGHLT
ncbi:Alcohol dehydrogenase GroES domain-containing protein (fragment) [Candidatus Nitrospira nitrificans]|uniref:Alcohol dehydrogenase GroES domain-containing protein n=1 Tax=Candidatus Nitrospira nitrificans TaxID=1742973 RepID=A0A0S4LAI3_9BACT